MEQYDSNINYHRYTCFFKLDNGYAQNPLHILKQGSVEVDLEETFNKNYDEYKKKREAVLAKYCNKTKELKETTDIVKRVFLRQDF